MPTKLLQYHEPIKHGILVKHGLNPDSIHVVANFADDELFQLQHSYSIDGKAAPCFSWERSSRVYGLERRARRFATKAKRKHFGADHR